MLLPDETYDDDNRFPNITANNILVQKRKANCKFKKRKDTTTTASSNRTPPGDVLSTSSSNASQGVKQKTLGIRNIVACGSGVNESYKRTADFFNNIPDFLGETFNSIDFARQRSDGQSDDDDDDGNDEHSERAGSVTHNSNDILRVCEDFLWRHRIRSDFFCQYHKAISSTVSSPLQSQSKTPKKEDVVTTTADSFVTIDPLTGAAVTTTAATTTAAIVVDEKNSTMPAALAPAQAPVERFSKLCAIYTLPVAKRKKSCNNLAGDTVVTDASSSNEAVHLQQRLKSLSTELVTLRNRLHVGQGHSAADSNSSNSGNAGTTSASQHHQQQGPIATGLTLNASSPNLHHSSTNTSGIGGTSVNSHSLSSAIPSALSVLSGNNNSVHHQQHQHSHQHQHQQHASIIPTLSSNNSNNNNNHGALTLSSNNNHSNHTNHSITHHHSKNLHTFSQTLPHSSTAATVLSASGGGGGIIPARNTSIPHPLPTSVLQHTTAANTLPMRSTAAHHLHHTSSAHHLNHHHHQLPFIPVQNPCHGISTLPFGFSSTNVGAYAMRSAASKYNNNNSSNCNSIGNYHKQPYELEDLIHLPGPLTEHSVMRTLQARFNENCYFTNVGPILLSINPYRDVGNPLTLSSTRSLPLAPQLHKIVQEAVRQQAETGYPQAIILSGTSGAGKTHCSMLLLRQLFAIAGGGPETDAFKHLAAAFTVLRSLGSAKTTTNSESSRIGQFIEVQVTDGALYRTKIHCYFLDQTRVIRPLPKEKNYHIFYQMLAGLNREERIKLNLEGYSPANLRYLQSGDIGQNEKDDAARFQSWKTCLGILGIPFLDVVRVLAAVLLLGNVQFTDGMGLEVDVQGESELNSVASLLGVPPAALFRGLTTRTHNARGQLVKSVCDANMSNMTRDCLAKALYCRTVATIVRRANSLKRLGSTLGTLSSDSNESVHNQAEVTSQHASTIGGNAGSKSMAALNNAVRHATDGFIGILDMFGFEEPSPHAQLEHLCINLCAETMQHFYNTHIFKSSVESCRDEGIACDTEVDYVDNVPCIDLISSLRTGLLSMLDAECSVRGTAENYVAKIKVQHRNSTRLETKHTSEPHDPRIFLIRHFAGRVEYDATEFLDTNRDVVPDDLVAVFYKHSCNFGFATHLFGSELKALYALQSVPRGLSFRISPTSHTDLLNGDEPVSTLTQDFHTRLDNLLRTLVHARPHFVRCIRSNAMESASCFERMTVVKQIRSLQVLETVNLMASGFPHRMRFKQFNARYRMLAPFRMLRRSEDKAMEDCNLILQYAMENPPPLDGSVTLAWAPGKRHVFLSEGIRQHLEHLRSEIRCKSATLIQATWRGGQWRKKMGNNVKQQRPRNGILVVPATKMTKSITSSGTNAVLPRLSAKTTNLVGTVTRPRPQPIAGTPPPDPNEKCDTKIIQQTCSLFGLDLERPPPVPASRSYTILGSSKLGYPQSRIMKMNFPEDSVTVTSATEQQLKKGETVNVVGALSSCRGHLIVEHKGQNFHVPFQYMELVRGIATAAAGAAGNANCSSNNNNNNNTNNSTSCNNNNNNSGNNNATTSAAVNI